MPLDLYVTRERSLAGAARPTPSARISREEIDGVFVGAPAQRRSDGAWWVRRPDSGEPWLTARAVDGSLVLSCSYSNHRFVANFPDMFDLGLKIAGPLQANVLEEVGGSIVTMHSVDELLRPEGEYVRVQAATCRGALQRMDEELMAGLEYPLGPVDLVREYCALVVASSGAADGVKSLLSSIRLPGEPRMISDGYAIIFRSGDPRQTPLVSVGVLDDGRVQVWPVHGRAPFAEAGPASVAVARQLGAVRSAPVTLGGRALEEGFESEVTKRVSGLGVEFYEWLTGLSP